LITFTLEGAQNDLGEAEIGKFCHVRKTFKYDRARGYGDASSQFVDLATGRHAPRNGLSDLGERRARQIAGQKTDLRDWSVTCCGAAKTAYRKSRQRSNAIGRTSPDRGNLSHQAEIFLHSSAQA
jgi:hypothetical protein